MKRVTLTHYYVSRIYLILSEYAQNHNISDTLTMEFDEDELDKIKEVMRNSNASHSREILRLLEEAVDIATG